MSLKHIETLRSLTFTYYTLEPLKALNLQAIYYTLLACKFRSFEDLF